MPEAPADTVTFLFTDIEGSTRLWEAHTEAMRAVLRQHDHLLRACIKSHGGRIFKTMGDAFFAVFTTPGPALETALAAQQRLPALALETSGGSLPLRVRMAVHTGAAEGRDGDYFGPALNRVARLLAIGHGGQVLVSGAARAMLDDELPPGASLQDWGLQRLRDLPEPEAVFQLLHPDLPAEFPPLRSLSAHPNNLPLQMTSFIGRETQTTEVKRLLRKTRMLSLTGTGGCGKTRLALEVAADVLERFPDGAWLVELAALSDPVLVPQAVAGVFGLKEELGCPLSETLARHLESRTLLLVLDNCEHLLPSCAELAGALLRRCPKVALLASSREGLGVYGEVTYRLPSLTLPDPAGDHSPESLRRYESVRLFIDRASQARTGFAVSERNAPAVASVCHRLDGIPLAIELAAARMRSMSVEEVNERLDQRFRLLTGGARTALPRQQTLRSLIDWSYDLLNESERILLRRLSVFSGGCTLQLAEQVCTFDNPGGEHRLDDWEILDLLASLSDKSLVLADQKGGTTRYRMLETVRQYAWDRLLESGEADRARARHLACFVALAEIAEPLLVGAEQQAWLGRLDAEIENLRAAFESSRLLPDGAEPALRLGGALLWYWDIRGLHYEGRQRLAKSLSLPGAPSRTAVRAKALAVAGMLASDQSDYADTARLCGESLAIYRELCDTAGVARVLIPLGWVAQHAGDLGQAERLYRESLALHQDRGDQGGCAFALLWLGALAQRQGDWSAARDLFEASLEIDRQLQNERSVAFTLAKLGEVAMRSGDLDTARARYVESLACGRGSQDRWSEMMSLSGQGHVALAQGDLEAARGLHEAALEIQRAIGRRAGIAGCLRALGQVARLGGDWQSAHAYYAESLSTSLGANETAGIAAALEGLALTAVAAGHPRKAAELLGAATTLREQAQLPPNGPEGSDLVACASALKKALGDAVFQEAQVAARARSTGEAVELALAGYSS